MIKKHLTDTKTSLILFLYLWVTYTIIYMTKNCFAGAMASIVADGIMTKTQTGILTAAFYAGYGILQFFGGKLADKYRPDILIVIGVIGAAVANIIIYLNQNYYVMLITWTLNACFQFGIWPAMFKIISSQLAHEHRIRGVYYISFAPTFGLVITFLCGALVKKWQDNFLFSAIALFILAIGLIFVYQKAAKKMVPDEDETPAKAIHDDFEISPELDTSSKTMFKKCGLYLILPAFFIRGLFELGVKNFAPTLLMESYAGLPDNIANLLNLPIVLAALIGMLITKFLYPKRINDVVKASLIFYIALLPFSFITIFIGKISLFTAIASFAISIAISAGSGLFTSYYSMRFAKYGKNGEVAGIINAAAAFGIVFQSFVLTLIADVWSWTAVMVILFILIIISVLLVAFILPKWKRFVREYHI